MASSNEPMTNAIGEENTVSVQSLADAMEVLTKVTFNVHEKKLKALPLSAAEQEEAQESQEAKWALDAEKVAKKNETSLANTFLLSEKQLVAEKLIMTIRNELNEHKLVTAEEKAWGELQHIRLAFFERLQAEKFKPLKHFMYNRYNLTNSELITTQKHLGLYAATLSNVSGAHTPHKTFPYKFPDYPYPGGWDIFTRDMGGTLFARPAPTRPRHGFVESRQVDSFVDLLKLAKETYAEDPFAEIIFMPKLQGKHSFVLTNAGITIGRGHDGVTNGSDPDAKFIPVALSSEQWNRSLVARMSHRFSMNKLDIKDTAYVEAVAGSKDAWNQGNVVHVVQLRDGPEQAASLEFIPRADVVKQIITQGGMDLLSWEMHLKTLVKENKGPNGILFETNHPLSSHYVVHAIENGIAVGKLGQRSVGSKLEASTIEVKKLSVRDLKDIRRHLLKAMSVNMDMNRYEADLAAATVHSMSGWGNDAHLLRLRAYGLAFLLRILNATILGELRYWGTYRGPGRHPDKLPQTPYLLEHGPQSIKSKSRETMYQDVHKMGFDEIIANVAGAKLDYRMGHWEGGFGGAAWANVARQTEKFAWELAYFLRTPTPFRWKRVTLAANVALHTAHNGGTAISKLTNLNAISVAPTMGFMTQLAAKIAREG
jgi:hypothetical protein